MLFRFTAFALSSSLLCTATTWHDIGPVIMDATVKATGLIHEASSMPDSGATPGQILDVYTEIVEVAHAYHSARFKIDDTLSVLGLPTNEDAGGKSTDDQGGEEGQCSNLQNLGRSARDAIVVLGKKHAALAGSQLIQQGLSNLNESITKFNDLWIHIAPTDYQKFARPVVTDLETALNSVFAIYSLGSN